SMPGFFTIRNAGKETPNIRSTLLAHISYLVSYLEDEGKRQEARAYLESFLQLRLNKPEIGFTVMNLLTIQEVKKVLNDMLVRYVTAGQKQKVNPFEERLAHARFVFMEAQVRIHYGDSKGLPISDYFLLALLSNVYDLSTGGSKKLV
ncbi:MAG: hypothetical protein WC838_05310, partial [Candidatus Margulisiibacteriota bacterium]